MEYPNGLYLIDTIILSYRLLSFANRDSWIWSPLHITPGCTAGATCFTAVSPAKTSTCCGSHSTEEWYIHIRVIQYMYWIWYMYRIWYMCVHISGVCIYDTCIYISLYIIHSGDLIVCYGKWMKMIHLQYFNGINPFPYAMQCPRYGTPKMNRSCT